MNRKAVALAASVFLTSLCGTPGKDGDGNGGAPEIYEVILSASSSDGQSFTQDQGYRFTNGYVDPYVLKAQSNNFLALVSTTPSSNRLPQQIYMAASTDGLNWQVNTNALITVAGGNALDPTAVALSNGTFRVYYTATTGVDPFSGFYLTSGIISTNANGQWSFAPDGVSLGINGVSSEAWALTGTAVRIYLSSSAGGLKVYRAEDGLTFSEETASFPPGSDPTIIELQDHSLRLYYVAMNASNKKEIYTAISTNGLTWTAEGTAGIAADDSSGNAWGVPDSFIDPDGKTRLFWVAMPSNAAPAAPSVACPLPVFSATVETNRVGRIQPGGSGSSVNFLDLSDAAWEPYQLIGATAHAPATGQIAVVVMDRATLVPYLVKAGEDNTYSSHEALFGFGDASVWAAYAVDAAGDLNADGFIEYVVRDRATGSTLLAYSAGATNQLQSTGYVLGIDPAALAGYRIEAAGDVYRDGYAELMVRDLSSGSVYLVGNNGAGAYDSVDPLFGLSASTWSQYHLESTGDFNGDGLLDFVVQDATVTETYKVFGTGSNSFASAELIPE
ncbi:MAG: VCBS repeat-containing protein [Lentisphaerae bacterium]|nr:VCBS repeat-containing protein [Lentisphaerota bacterium]